MHEHSYSEKQKGFKYAPPVKIHLVMNKTEKSIDTKQSFQNSLTNI